MILILGSDDALSPVERRAWQQAKTSYTWPNFYKRPLDIDDVIGSWEWAVRFLVGVDPATIIKALLKEGE